MDDRIDIAFGFDDPYVPHIAAAIASVVANARGGRFRFILLSAGVGAERRAQVESVAPDAEFCWIEVSDDDLPAFNARGHLNRTTLFRLGLETLAPADCRRVLYLDGDLTVAGDVREVWRTDLGGDPLGAVADNVDAAGFAQRWGLAPGPAYFNAGVLLIDLERVRAEKIFSAAITFLAEHGDALPWNDQDALNWPAWGRWKPLDAVWNVQRYMVLAGDDAAAGRLARERRPSVVHYTGYEKPWLPSGYHPWAWLYWRNLSRTPFQREVTQRHNVGFSQKLRIWLRWLVRRPSGSALV